MSNSSDNPLWHVVSGENVPPPDWVNAPNQRGNRLFTPYEKIIAERDRLEVVFNARMARWANLGPTLTFALLIAIVLFKFDAPGFGVCFALLGVATCAISLWIVRIQERSGSYLIIDLKTRTIALPRRKVAFSWDSIHRFQWVYSKYVSHLVPDLYLISKDSSGELMRYHIMCSPSRSLLERLVRITEIPLELRDEFPNGWMGYVQNWPLRSSESENPDTDRNNPVPFKSP